MKKIVYLLTLLPCLFFFKSNLNAQTDHTIGTGTSTNSIYSYPCPFPDGYESTKQQFLFRASELTGAGMSGGTITTLKWTVVSLGAAGANEEYTIKMGTTALTTLSSTGWESGLTTVYGPVIYTPTSGVNAVLLSTPFYWNGTDNIIIEICHGDPNGTSSSVYTYTENPAVEYSTVSGFNASRLYADDDQGNGCGYSGTGSGNGTQNAGRRPNTTFTLVAGPPPTCAQPTGLNAVNISATSADLSWSAVTSASGYEYAVTTSSTPPASGTPITATSTPSGTLTASTTYYLHVRTDCGVNGSSLWSTYSFNTLLVNDNAVDATLLTVGTACSGAPNGTLVGATVQANEPAVSCELVAGAFNSVWYKFVAPASGMVRISTDHNTTGGMDDTKIGVYQVTNPADFNTYQIIGCDEDNGTLGFGYNSIIYLTTLTPSATYYIKVDKYDGSTTSGPFCIDVMPITPAMLASTPNCTGTEFENYNPNGGNAWVSLVDDNTGQLVANMKTNGNNVDDVLTNYHQNTGAVRTYNSQHYLDRNYAIEVDVPPTTPVDVQLFFTDADYNALVAAAPSTTMANLGVTRLANASCATTYNPASQTVSYLPQTGNGSSGGVRYVQMQTPGFSGFFIHAGANPLAVDLKNITAANVGAQNRVDWKTATEARGDMFEVERSLDGENFKHIGTVSAKGTGGEYTYWDGEPGNGINYYRLKMTSAAGEVSYSSVVQAMVKATDRFMIEAYPNPVKDAVTIKTFGSSEAGTASVVLTDITGKPVRQVILHDYQTEINMTDLAPGIYFIKYADGIHDQTIRISKQ